VILKHTKCHNELLAEKVYLLMVSIEKFEVDEWILYGYIYSRYDEFTFQVETKKVEL